MNPRSVFRFPSFRACVELRVERQPLVQEAQGLVGSPGSERLHDLDTGLHIHDGAPGQGVVEAPELQEDPIHAAYVVQVGLGFPEEVDGVIVPPAEPEPAAVAFLLAGSARGFFSHEDRAGR